jgi:uridine kinase
VAHRVIEETVQAILKAKRAQPLLVGISGIDAAGKSYFGDELAECLKQAGVPVIRASIDGFHNPREMRYRQGIYSPEGYYHDSFNYVTAKKYLLDPLAPRGNRRYRTSAFDHKSNSENISAELVATEADILIFDGIFIFRSELVRYWDFKIFLEIDFETSLERALKRDLALLESEEEVRKRYRERYIPAQKMYLESEKPREKADIIINNNDYANPTLKVQNPKS